MTFTALNISDLATIGLLVFLEGVLSIDNALVLALIAGKLPLHQQKKALSYGLIGAVAFRVLAIGMASYLLRWRWVKYVGATYLIYLATNHWYSKKQSVKEVKKRSFWVTVLVIELTDISFAVDSILTAVALSKKLSVVVTGGVLGVILMRFAAGLFIKLLRIFPRFESTAYALVLLIGLKLLLEAFDFASIDFHSASNPAFWIFWLSLFLLFFLGFTGKKRG